jgi:hypothetical protein
LLHVDLKFIPLQDAAKRVDDPVVLWERVGRLTAAAKVGRGELFEAAEFLSFLRSSVFGPLGKRQLGLRPTGVRPLEALAPELADELKRSVAAPEAGSILAAIHVCVDLYRRMRSADPVPIHMRTRAETGAVEYVTEIEQRLAAAP